MTAHPFDLTGRVALVTGATAVSASPSRAACTGRRHRGAQRPQAEAIVGAATILTGEG